MQARLRKTLLRVGVPSLPEDAQAPLADYGLDSLLVVLSVAALEAEFSVRIPAEKVESFVCLDSMEQLLRSLGAK